MIRFKCECGRLLQAPEDYAGKPAGCPSCNRVNTVPSRDAPTRPDDAVQTAGPPSAPEPAREAVQAERRSERYDEEEPRERERGRRREIEDDEPLPAKRWTTSGKALAAMILGLLSVLCLLNIFTGLPAVIFGALALKDINQNARRLGGQGLAITGIITGVLGMVVMVPLVLLALLIPAVQKVREASARMQSTNNLKQMGLALMNYHDANGNYPHGGAIRSKDGKPLLSWRVAILPSVEQISLYQQFNLKEPWDSPTNKRLLTMMPKIYKVPGDRKSAPEGQTFYRAFIGRGAVFDPTLPRATRLTDITDGTSNTLLVVEAANAVEWTRPEDLPFDATSSLPQLGGHFSAGFNAAFADGSVRLIPAKTPEATIRAMITRSGGEIITLP